MQYQDLRNGRFYLGDNVEVMRSIPEGVIDLTVTSPPYDNLREYTGESEWTWEKFTQVAKELYRVTKEGGVVIWNVNDATINGSETGTSFRQALYFKDECGFNLHDTMIYDKGFAKFPASNRMGQGFEYIFCFSIGKPKTFNHLMVPCAEAKKGVTNKKITDRNKDGTLREKFVKINETRPAHNVIKIDSGYMRSTKYKDAYKHPAIFPEYLAKSQIEMWSNEGDVVLDPFMGSGTTACAAIETNRKWVGIEIAQDYADLAVERIKAHKQEKE